MCFFCHKPGHIARVCPSGQRKPKPGQRGQQKVRQVAEEGTTDESNTKDNQADNNESDNEFQIYVAQADIDFYNTDF